MDWTSSIKASKVLQFLSFWFKPLDGWMDGRTVGQTDAYGTKGKT